MSSYTNIFTGNVVEPSPLSYLAISLDENIELSWPTQFQNANPPNPVVASILDVSPTGGGFNLTLPDCTETSVGQSILINNPTANTFTLKKNDGSTLAVIAAPSVNYFYLIDNSTAAGVWRQTPYGGGYAAVTSVAATSSTSNITIGGSPITTTGTFTFGLANDLAALTGFNASTGISARTAANTWALRTITGTANQIQVTNGSGVAGNPTLSLASNISGITSVTASNIQVTNNNINAVNVNGSIILTPNGTGSVQVQDGKALAWYESGGANFFSLTAAAMASDVALTLPNNSPTTGQVLQASSPTALQWANVTTFSGASTVNAIARYNGTGGSLTNSGVLLDNSNNITGVNSITIGNLDIGISDGNTISSFDSNGNIKLAPNGTGETQSLKNISIKGGNQLKLFSSSDANFAYLTAPNANLNVGWELPLADGAANSFMKTSGLGVLSFSTIIDVIATKADLQTNPPTNATHPVVPSTIGFALGAAKAWVLFDGTAGSPTAAAQYNVSSITKNSTGNFTINFATSFASVSYVGVGSIGAAGFVKFINYSTGNATIITSNITDVATDNTATALVFFGTQ